MTATTADDLRTNVIGTWPLLSYESFSIDGYTSLDAARANAPTGTWG
jgi:hypothetical protein